MIFFFKVVELMNGIGEGIKFFFDQRNVQVMFKDDKKFLINNFFKKNNVK